MARDIPIQANVDEDLYKRLKTSSDKNLRSMSAEIYLRLKASYDSEKPLAAATTTEG